MTGFAESSEIRNRSHEKRKDRQGSACPLFPLVAVRQAAGKGKGRVAPAKIVVARRVFLKNEALGRDRIGAVGHAQQEAGQGQPDVAGVLRFAEGAPLGVLRHLEDGLEVLEVGQLLPGVDAEELLPGRAHEGRMRHGGD